MLGKQVQLLTLFPSSSQTGFTLGVAIAAQFAISKDRGPGSTFKQVSHILIFVFRIKAVAKVPSTR